MASGNFNHFPVISDRLHKALNRAVKKVATDLKKDAADLAPVDTGFLRDSIYVVTSESSTYGQGVKQAGVLKPNKKGVIRVRSVFAYIKRLEKQKAQEAMLLNEIVGSPGDDLTAYVAVAANYGAYQEFGTRFMPAQPFFYPAVEIANVNLDGQLALVEAQLSNAVVSGLIEVADEP